MFLPVRVTSFYSDCPVHLYYTKNNQVALSTLCSHTHSVTEITNGAATFKPYKLILKKFKDKQPFIPANIHAFSWNIKNTEFGYVSIFFTESMWYFQNRFFQNFSQILFLREEKGNAKMFCLALFVITLWKSWSKIFPVWMP